MAHKRKALVLVNVGTPDDPGSRSVRKYLTQFLNDKKVIDLPWLVRKLLVNIIIIPFRKRRSSRLYRMLWQEGGSPLLIYLASLVDKVSGLLPGHIDIYGAMRYGNPSLEKILGSLNGKEYSEIKVLPLYPQYAESTSGSVIELVNRFTEKAQIKPRPLIIEEFWSHPSFINCFAENIRSYLPGKFDHIIFSYHGLPLRQVKKIHPAHKVEECICEKEMPEWGQKCYKASCYGTTRLLAEKLSLESDRYTTSFQSRLTRNWLSPFTDETIKRLADSGVKKLLVVAPSFVSDCLETIIEIEQDYRDLFLSKGGKELILVKSLNDSTSWARAILDIALADS
ncbi:MAG: ferrochelatase [Bacteroidota bacterium]